MGKKLFLLDGHSLAHRAFYALPLLQNSHGEFTNAVFGFARMLFKLLDDEKPDLVLVAFDHKGPTFRHQEYKEYKANRKKMPDELSPQIPVIKGLLAALKIPTLSLAGYEADDLIGTLAKNGEKEGFEVKIVTGDRDSIQLVDQQINVIYTRKGISDIVHYDLAQVRERYELVPDQLIDLKGLMGDSSDNIPGVPGIGEKTAITLLKEFSSLENILDNIEQIPGKKRRENLREYSEQARLSKELGRIMTDVPVRIDWADCRLAKPDEAEIVKLLERLEFASLLDRFRPEQKLSEEEIVIKNLTTESALSDLCAEIRETGAIAFDLLLDDYSRPVESKVESWVIALERQRVFSLPFTEQVRSLLKPLLIDQKIKKYILHAKEVIVVLEKRGLELVGLDFDPLLATYLLNPSDQLPSLETQLKSELNLVLPEDLAEDKKTAISVANLFKMRERLLEKLKKRELLTLYRQIELPLVKVLARMELNGIKLDRDYLAQLSEKWEQGLNSLTAEVYSLAGQEFNLNSPKQLGEILFDKLALPVIKKTKTGYSTSVQVLEELKEQHDIIPKIMEYRQLMKLKSTYVDALPPLINAESGRIHTSFNQMVTATGRLSSTEPNLQNIPIRTEEGREIRKAFLPGEHDWLLLAVDYSQIELRVLAHISGDDSLIAAFTRGDDIHTQTASEIFQVPAGEVTPAMRREAKVINFGIAYGMSPFGLARDLMISRPEAEDYINRYFERFAGVKAYMEQVVAQARNEGYVTTIFRRRRYIPEITSRNYHRRTFAERTAINTPIQGSAADIMKIAMFRVAQKLQAVELRARMLLQVHDELVLEVHRDDLAGLTRLVREEMESAVQLNVPLPVNIQIGENWRDKYKINDNGVSKDA